MVSCDFDQHSCRHDSLFLDEYKRTNRTKGTKILRCFPHCCPEHVNRSYCGSALYCQIQFQAGKRRRSENDSSSLPLASHPDEVLVFAHFEEAGANPYHLHDQLAYNTVMNSIQTEQNPKGEWIEGLPHDTIDHMTHRYQINPGARWYYEWESAATKAQRFTKHVLRLYVFQKEVRADKSVASLRIVGIATSSEFMVVSYRRAPNEVRGGQRILAMLAENAINAEELGIEKDQIISSLRKKVIPLLSTKGKSSPSSSASLSPVMSHHHQPFQQHASFSPIGSQAWGHTNEDILQLAKRVGTLRRFLEVASTAAIARDGSVWSSHMMAGFAAWTVDNWQLADINNREIAINSIASQLSWDFLMPGSSPSGHDRIPSLRSLRVDESRDRLSNLVRQCAESLLSIQLDGHANRMLLQILHEGAGTLLDKAGLQREFATWIATFHDFIDQSLQARFGCSFRQLNEAITAAVFQFDEFQSSRSEFLNLLSSSRTPEWNDFVSQSRASFVQDQHNLKRKRPASPGDLNALLAFQGRWLSDTRRFAIYPLDTRLTGGPSMACALDWLREWAAVSIAVDTETLCIASVCTSAVDNAMTLILDGRRRIFECFPSGMSSAIPMGGLLFGDYRGHIVGDQDIMLEFVAWPCASSLEQDKNAQAYRWKFRLQVNRELSSRLLVVDGLGERTPCGVHADASPAALSFDDKVRSIAGDWTPVCETKGVYCLV
ncbi:hypothetical protein Poli38472_009905 [Pythium oligandrum]|uniref:Uncharacterized protein n=1 Tax=Pythium oligandrum TaxID=41045 RepID=A0A8K1C8G6_PYTOL|nr:hypothetical protein Poli38472_009905 [Pythium oligandrum]|eukprot:TMW58346.1 hypothetical protein Poli38472_009905 [Pythium oligandrum]